MPRNRAIAAERLKVASRRRGQHTMEFAGALVILIMVIAIPLIDLAVIPMRRALAQQVVQQSMRKLRLSQSISQAFRQHEGADAVTDGLGRIGGIRLRKSVLSFDVSDKTDKTKIQLAPPSQIPVDWLPDGRNCPCLYMLTLNVEMDIYPLFLVPLGGQSIPGLSAPIPTTITESSVFENQGRNPATSNYYMNE